MLLLEKNAFGGQMNDSPRIENYPGIPSISGLELADRMMRQIIDQGAQVELENAGHYDYFVINDTVDNAVAELRAIMLAEHCRPADRIAELNQ